jgi:ABC-type lipoprotein release transport system permease subunit
LVATPVGYEAFQGKRRKSIALLCFMLSSAIIVSMMVFVDSYSIPVWNSKNDVGPVSLVALGSGIDSKIDEFREIAGITRAAGIRGIVAHLASSSLGLLWQASTFGMEYSEEFVEAFPTIFTLIEGRFPENNSEIAISALTADRLYAEIGDQVNFSFSSVNPYNPSYQPSIVIGIFEHGERNQTNPYYYSRGHVLFHSSLRSSMSFGFIYADIDRSRVVPYDPTGALNYLNEIDEQIRRLDIYYARGGSAHYAVINFLSNGIEDYVTYLLDLRLSQILRSGGVILLELAVIYLAINHTWNERDYEINMLIARGASRFRVDLIVNLEIITMAVLSIVPGLVVGVVASRFAIASEGFFVISFQRVLSEPLLVSYDSLFYSIITGVGLPLTVLGIHQMRNLVRLDIEERTGKLAKITKALRFMKGDVVLLLLSVAFLIALNIAGTIVTRNPLLYSILGILPFTLFFGMTSLALKGLRRGANQFSRAFSVIVGQIPAAIGIRRISKVTMSSGPLIIILVLAMSLGWNYAINDATLPYTRLNQSRFAIGGDLAFHLDSDESEHWESFFGNLTHNIPSSRGSLLSMLSLSLSTGAEGSYEFVALNPTEYSLVGYDSIGSRLNESTLGLLMEQLSVTQLGAIITQDIANQYSLSTGGLLRAFWRNETELVALEFTIIGVVEALPDTLTFSSGYNPYPGIEWTYAVGTGKVWVNRDAVENIFSNEPNVKNVFCMRVEDQSNATLIAKEQLTDGWMNVLDEDEWASASREVEIYTTQDIYVLDRSTDTLLTILSVGIIFGGFTVYAIEGVKSRRREIALLKSLGAERNLVIKTQASEMLVLLLISIILLGLFTPVLAVNSLLAAVRTYGGVIYVYPAPVTILIPWFLMVLILSFFILCVAIFIGVIAIFSSRVNLSEALNSTWTTAGPYKEET